VGHKFRAARHDEFKEGVAGFERVVTKVHGGLDLELPFRKSALRRRMCIFMSYLLSV
jgi:hypothetical protein